MKYRPTSLFKTGKKQDAEDRDSNENSPLSNPNIDKTDNIVGDETPMNGVQPGRQSQKNDDSSPTNSANGQMGSLLDGAPPRNATRSYGRRNHTNGDSPPTNSANGQNGGFLDGPSPSPRSVARNNARLRTMDDDFAPKKSTNDQNGDFLDGPSPQNPPPRTRGRFQRKWSSMGMGTMTTRAPENNGSGANANGPSFQQPKKAHTRMLRSRSMGLGARDPNEDPSQLPVAPGFPPRVKKGKKNNSEDRDFLDITYRKDWMAWSESMDRKIQRQFATGTAADLDRPLSKITIAEREEEEEDPYVTPGYTGEELVSDDEPEDPYVTPGYTGTELVSDDEPEDPYVTTGYTGTELVSDDEPDDPYVTPGYTGTELVSDDELETPYKTLNEQERRYRKNMNPESCDALNVSWMAVRKV